jgi:hypothetical protein
MTNPTKDGKSLQEIQREYHVNSRVAKIIQAQKSLIDEILEEPNPLATTTRTTQINQSIGEENEI